MIAVIIVEYNCEALTRRVVSSMQAISRDDLRFYVVDDGQLIDTGRWVPSPREFWCSDPRRIGGVPQAAKSACGRLQPKGPSGIRC